MPLLSLERLTTAFTIALVQRFNLSGMPLTRAARGNYRHRIGAAGVGMIAHVAIRASTEQVCASAPGLRLAAVAC